MEYRNLNLMEWNSLDSREQAKAAIHMSSRAGEANSRETLKTKIMDYVHLANLGAAGVPAAVKLQTLNRRFSKSARLMATSVSDLITELIDDNLIEARRIRNIILILTKKFDATLKENCRQINPENPTEGDQVYYTRIDRMFAEYV